MKLLLPKHSGQAIELASQALIEQIREKPDSVLGLATGDTMVAIYAHLRRAVREGLETSSIQTFNLDEYLGIGPEHAYSYHRYMREHLFGEVNVLRSHIPDGLTKDIHRHCLAYENSIQECGGLDLQLLGLGQNGHIGFNEPGSSLGSRTRAVRLSAQTRQVNRSRVPGTGEVPPRALTLGVGTILDSRRILLVALGPAKASPLQAALEGPITAMCPASALQWHPNCQILADPEAAQQLLLRDYHLECQQDVES